MIRFCQLAALLIASFAVMLWLGMDLVHTKPPIPDRVITTSGETVYTKDDIQHGQQVWQSIGGQQLSKTITEFIAKNRRKMP